MPHKHCPTCGKPCGDLKLMTGAEIFKEQKWRFRALGAVFVLTITAQIWWPIITGAK